MDIAVSIIDASSKAISCIEMHTTGEPVRVVYAGYPELSGTLLEQREEARSKYDAIRKQIMLEPRGHNDMYGAILRPKTELVSSSDAHIGVLFCHNEGYSTMCGHATIALGRFLIDTHDLNAFPKRESLTYSAETQTTELLLHAPCGIVEVTVPVLEGGQKSDPSRAVSFLSVPCYAVALDLEVKIPPSHRWPELGDRSNITIDISYGGTFYCLVSCAELGFPSGLRKSIDLGAMDRATASLKAAIQTTPEVAKHVKNVEHQGLSFLYSVMVVDDGVGVRAANASGAETGLCFFADQQIDRSPTGSCVGARMAAAFGKGKLKVEDSWTYHSVVSNGFGDQGGFVGKIDKEVDVAGALKGKGVIVRTEGNGWYTGRAEYIVEDGDSIGAGFRMKDLAA